MDGKTNNYSFATLESFGNTNIFINPFFEFSVASGKLAARIKIYKTFAVFGFYIFKISGGYCKEYSTIAILVVFNFSRLNRVCLNFISICKRNPFVVEVEEFGFGVPFSQWKLNFTDNGVIYAGTLRECNARLNDNQEN